MVLGRLKNKINMQTRMGLMMFLSPFFYWCVETYILAEKPTEFSIETIESKRPDQSENVKITGGILVNTKAFELEKGVIAVPVMSQPRMNVGKTSIAYYVTDESSLNDVPRDLVVDMRYTKIGDYSKAIRTKHPHTRWKRHYFLEDRPGFFDSLSRAEIVAGSIMLLMGLSMLFQGLIGGLRRKD